MKRILIWMLILMMLAMSTAMAESDADLPGGVRLTAGEPVSIDLDSDGAAETVLYEMQSTDYDDQLRVTVTDADGRSLTWDTEITSDEGGWIVDLNGDGVQELFVWGDVMSSDYYTTCLNYVNGRLRPLLFADIERGENGNGYFKEGYGYLAGADPQRGTVSLCGSQDVLGTWFGARTLRLSEDGLFEVADDGWWTRLDIPEGDEAWAEDWWSKTLLMDVECLIDGKEDTLKAGERIIITGSDKQNQASFITEDGRTGILSVEENYDDWGWKVNDIPEAEVFDNLNYAD